MDENKVVLSKHVTPVTKRIGLVCLTVLACVAVIGSGLDKIEIKDALLIVIPVITSISALIDGGK